MAKDGLTITLKTSFFFDSEKVQRSVDRMIRRNLSRQGAFLRTRARSSIKRRKKISRPGQPPHAHSTSKYASIKNILFAYEPVKETVVVGPVSLGRAGPKVPTILESGGLGDYVHQVETDDGWLTVSKRRVQKTNLPVRKRRFVYKPRPFMGPALEHEISAGNVSAVWKDSLHVG